MKGLLFTSVLLSFLLACTSPKSETVSKEDTPVTMKEITLESKGCYGTCPQFKLTINQDGTASYEAGKYNQQRGSFTTTIRQSQRDSLIRLVQAVNYPKQPDSFPALVSDVVEYKSTLTLTDGSIKTIIDQGPNGPSQLKSLYDYLLLLKTTQSWNIK